METVLERKSRHLQTCDKCIWSYRRGIPVEPLAFSLDPEHVASQHQCSLFSKIPAEIREQIYEYALTDCTSHPPNADNPYRGRAPRGMYTRFPPGHTPPSDVAFPLLRTCKAIYLEAYKLPLLLNGFIEYAQGRFPYIHRPDLGKLAPWQFALIGRLDITLQQIALEGTTRSSIRVFLAQWGLKERHEGSVVWTPEWQFEPKFGPLENSTQFANVQYVSHEPLEDGVPRTADPKQDLCPIRVMVARPITYFTIRLSRTDWWAWTLPPNRDDDLSQLGLDPAWGNGGSVENIRCLQSCMVDLAKERRNGQLPVPNPYHKDPPPTRFEDTWGSQVARFPDLKVLELVLEMFGDKKSQLELVVECAKTWRFPLDDAAGNASSYELVWNGKVEEANWKMEDIVRGIGREGWDTSNTDVEVRIIRFTRRRIPMTQ